MCIRDRYVNYTKYISKTDGFFRTYKIVSRIIRTEKKPKSGIICFERNAYPFVSKLIGNVQLNRPINAILFLHKPVSYTHLDVYKRQYNN